tara:strand:- start:3970 stop:4620 length:651 start_codon:yes stop_codon:yes gene_type:complete
MSPNYLLFHEFQRAQPYEAIFHSMRDFTLARNPGQQDEIWLMEHNPVFTQGQAGKAEHILNPNKIPIVQSDRGGQVTYHGPGQLMIYVLWDLKALNLSVRKLVCTLENLVIALLKQYGITAHRIEKAPGIYVDNQKISSLGLRVKKGCCYHGLSLNVDMDLTPFEYINPCGFTDLKMTQMKDFIPEVSMPEVKKKVQALLESQYQLQQNQTIDTVS